MPANSLLTTQISSVEQEMEGMLHGTTLNQITNLFGAFDRAGRRILELVDPQETKVVAQFGKVYQGVFDYPCFVDQKGNKVIDFYPQANRTLVDNYRQRYNKDFNLWKNYTTETSFTPRYSNGVRTLQVNAFNLVQGIQLNAADAVSDNGTWFTGGNASGIFTNNLFYTTGVAGSVSFQLNQTGVAGSTATITNKSFTAINLTNNYNNDDEFFQVYLPNAAGIMSLDYQFGTANAAGTVLGYYDSGTITTDSQGNAFVNGWNLVKVPWSTMTTNGSPNIASINYINLTFTYNGTLQTQVCINQFYSRTGFIFNEEYYSKYLFRDATTGIFQERVTDESNYINLDTDGIDMFIWAAFAAAVQQQQGLDALFSDGPTAEEKFQEAVTAYKAKYKSEVQKPQSLYYPNRQASYRRWFGFGRGNNQ